MKKNLMDREAASRIQSATCKQNSGITPKSSFAARAMSAAYKNEPLTVTPTELRSRKNNTSNFFQQPDSDSDSDDDNIALLALGTGAVVLGGLALYAAIKEEEEKEKSCCEKYCLIM